MTANELLLAALEKRAIVSVSQRIHPIVWARKPIPAAFVIGMPFRLVAEVLPFLEVYEKKESGK